MSTLKVVVLLLAAFLGTSYAEKCTAICPRSLPTSIVPKVQSTYVYGLEAKTVLTPRDTLKVTVKADAEVAIENVCEATLRLKNVVIEGVPNGAELAGKVATNPIGFGYHNGKVRGVCPTKDEEEWATNIKKAVISALQVSFTGEASFSADVEEEDFAGKCTASFTRLEQGAQGTVLQKKKDLNRCSERRVDLRQTPDQALGQFKELLRQHLHPVDSQQSCRITLKDQVVKEVECEETHSLVHRHEKPITTASLKLTLKSSKDGIASDFAAREVLQQPNLYLTHQHKTVHTATEADVVAKLKELCAQVSDKTSSLEASTAFNELVDLLKYLPADAAASVDAAVKAGSAICPAVPKRLRELFLDASAFAASDSAIKTLVRAHNAKELTITRAAAAFTVVALKAQPNEETVRALLPLIDSDSTTRPLLLGFSVLIRRYCEKTNDCATNAAIAEARDVYANRIAKTTDKLVKVTLIKALENLNVNPTGGEKAVKQLEEIINSAEAGDAARLAAVKALPTTAGAAGQLKSIVLNEALPNEVRIAAFQKLAASSAGLKDVGQLLAVQEHCVKNYIGTYVKNLRASKNPVRRSLVPDTVELKEEPNTNFGISKNIAYEYGPLTVDVDVVYPKNSNVTQSISARISKISNDKVVTIAELSVRQEGLDKQVGNVLNAISRKITPSQFGFELVKDLSALVQKLKQKDHTHNHLQLAAQVNGKNILFTDAFEDLHTLVDLLRKRIEKVIDEKKVDRTIGGVLIDTKVVVPTVSGIPLVYKLTDNFVIQINGEVSKDGSKSRVILNRSLIAGIRASVKLLLKDQKLGFEYNGKLALTPNIDVEAEKKEKGVQIKLNLKEDRKTLLKFKQSLREIKQAGTDVTSENELAPEPRSDNCVSVLILNYCRKATQVKGLKIPNVEYYLTKPEAGINAIVLDLVTDNADPTAKKYTIKISALGGSKSYEHLAQLEFLTPAGGAKEMKLLLKSPENTLDTKFSINVGSSTVNVKLNLPNVIDIDVTNTMTENAEKNGGTSNMLIEYKFPEDPTKHSIKWNSKAMANLKRTGKDKVANFEYAISFESSRRPSLNHRFLVDFKYRPYKLNEVKLEFAYGKDMAFLYKFARTSKIDVQEFRPFKLSSESETEIIATDFDVDYHLKADTKLLNDKGNALEFDLNLKGKDRSRRAAGKDNEITGKVMYRNKGATVDSKLEASLKGHGRDYGWNSELKQVEPHKYEGKITVQLDKDRKVFITHKEEASKPTKDFSLKSEADITYSFKPDKKSYKLEVKKVGTAINLKGEVTKDGKVLLSNDVNFESSNGKLKALLTRDTRSYDLTVDNVYKPKDAALIFKIEDRVYNIKLNREPMKYINLKVDGNDKALIKSGTAHLSIIDASKLNLVTKANTKIDTSLDLLSTVTKKASLKVDSPKFNFKHEGDIELSLVNRRLNWKSYTKKDTREYKFNADIARKGSAISLQKIVPERTSSVQYSRNGEKIEINIDTEYLQGKVEGDRRAGKIVLKNKDKNYSLESTYKLENRKLVIESVSSNNAKLEAVISRIAPSKLVLETPNTKANVALDLSAPVKTFKLDFDNPKYSKKITAESEPGKRFKYSSYGKIKEGNREQKIEVNGKPLKELNVDIQFPDFKLKVEQPEASKKVKFSYTFNNYTEDEEFDFDPNKAYFANWISAIRHYAQTFLVQTA